MRRYLNQIFCCFCFASNFKVFFLFSLHSSPRELYCFWMWKTFNFAEAIGVKSYNVFLCAFYHAQLIRYKTHTHTHRTVVHIRIYMKWFAFEALFSFIDLQSTATAHSIVHILLYLSIRFTIMQTIRNI